MAELGRLARMGFARLRTPLFAAACTAAASSCATAPAALTEPVKPRIRWVLHDVELVGGIATQVLGRPVLACEGASTALCFDGRNDALILPFDPLQRFRQFTIEILFRPDPDGPAEQRFFHVEDQAGQRALLEIRLDNATRRWCLDTYLHASLGQHRTLIDRAKTHPAGDWYWVALVYDGSTMAHFVSAVKELDGRVRFPPMTAGKTSIGARLNQVNWFKGAIREVRIYDRVLASQQLSR